MKKKLIFISLGLGGLALGTSVYIWGRPLTSTYLGNNLKSFIPSIGIPDIFGHFHFSQWVPDFLHAFSFSIISIGLFSKSRRSRVTFCLLWLGIDSLFEIGQRYGAEIAAYIPYWFNNIPVIENTRNYFVKGRFDIKDLVAIFLGVLAAFILSELIKGGGRYEGKNLKIRGCISVLQNND